MTLKKLLTSFGLLLVVGSLGQNKPELIAEREPVRIDTAQLDTVKGYHEEIQRVLRDAMFLEPEL